MKIVWSIKSKKQIEKMIDNYSKKIISSLFLRAQILLDFPEIGQKEYFLFEYPQNFRYLIEGNFKIIYWIDGENIRISSVFDTRQDPDKIKIFD